MYNNNNKCNEVQKAKKEGREKESYTDTLNSLIAVTVHPYAPLQGEAWSGGAHANLSDANTRCVDHWQYHNEIKRSGRFRSLTCCADTDPACV
jgi:hypothetical protein